MLSTLLEKIVEDHDLHLRWLNTLSFMENCGATKIANCQDPVRVPLTMLKHAAEESRHAFVLKNMTKRLERSFYLKDYSAKNILGSYQSKHYLNKLDIATTRHLLKSGYKGDQAKWLAYLIVTYVIEVRADNVYPTYQKLLTQTESPVSVEVIIKEEETHLQEMIDFLDRDLPHWRRFIEPLLAFENELFENWCSLIGKELALCTLK